MAGSRRFFLKQWAAAPALALAPLPRDVPGGGSSFDPWVEVREDHLRHNVARSTAAPPGAPSWP